MERTRVNLLQYVAQVTPLFWVLIGLTVLVGIGEVVLIALAARRRTSGWLAIAAAAGPVLLATAAVAAIRVGHTTFLRGMTSDDPTETIALIHAGLEGFMNAQPLGLLLLGAIVILAAIAASLHASGAFKLPPSPLAIVTLVFVGAGLGPFLYGALRYSTDMIKILAGVAGVDPEMKAFMVTRGIEESRETFDQFAIAGAVGFGVALVVGIVTVAGAAVRSQPTRIRWVWPAVCLIAAAGLYLAAEPMRAEIAAPWPPSPCSALTINRVATPNVDGPDQMPRAEVVTVSDKLLLGDGAPRSLEEWHDSIVVMRNNYRLLHPADLVDENLVVVCTPETTKERLVEILRVARQAEYRRPAFAFGRETTLPRPTMGTLRRWQWTAAKTLMPGVGPETPAPVQTLRLADYPTCDAIARAAAAIRRAGKFPGLAF